MYSIITPRETFSCDAKGHIGRPSIGMTPSGKWKALALIRRSNFGSVVETIPFDYWPTRISTLQWAYKNGKPRYTLHDLDHGTAREWGSGVTRIYAN